MAQAQTVVSGSTRLQAKKPRAETLSNGGSAEVVISTPTKRARANQNNKHSPQALSLRVSPRKIKRKRRHIQAPTTIKRRRVTGMTASDERRSSQQHRTSTPPSHISPCIHPHPHPCRPQESVPIPRRRLSRRSPTDDPSCTRTHGVRHAATRPEPPPTVTHSSRPRAGQKNATNAMTCNPAGFLQ
ncbi:hypothetical protein EI94DRAFT_866792 [Lactarius quietus]|nr:hypothetical protein EI94DRAFT_866792 [Lactarius quietus]